MPDKELYSSSVTDCFEDWPTSINENVISFVDYAISWVYSTSSVYAPSYIISTDGVWPFS